MPRKPSPEAGAQDTGEKTYQASIQNIPEQLHDRLAMAKIKSKKTLQELYHEALELLCNKYKV